MASVRISMRHFLQTKVITTASPMKCHFSKSIHVSLADAADDMGSVITNRLSRITKAEYHQDHNSGGHEKARYNSRHASYSFAACSPCIVYMSDRISSLPGLTTTTLTSRLIGSTLPRRPPLEYSSPPKICCAPLVVSYKTLAAWNFNRAAEVANARLSPCFTD